MENPVYSAIKASSRLPSPVGIALEILRLAKDEDTTVQEIANLIKQDPATASRLLQFVNSPLAGLSGKIASISEAVTLLGLNTVKSIAVGFSLVGQHGHGPCKAFDYQAFWAESIARATAARRIAHQLRTFAPDEAFTGGLLGQIGRLAFATVHPDSYTDVLQTAASDDPAALLPIERRLYDIDHNELAAEMMTDWHLPDALCAAARFQDAPNLGKLDPGSPQHWLARTLHLAGQVALILTQSRIRQESLTATSNHAHRLGIRPDVFPSVFDSITDEWPAMGFILGVATRNVMPWDELSSRSV
ncbi:MAG: HDOD domain-containing protein [Planctomycetota bacterium]